jgi:hypothetical protein
LASFSNRILAAVASVDAFTFSALASSLTSLANLLKVLSSKLLIPVDFLLCSSSYQ